MSAAVQLPPPEPVSETLKRQDFSRERTRRDTKFGDYVLGQTLGEGEFGKVKMGWKVEGGLQIAIKLIRREKLDTPGRLSKVHREIAILRQVNHPNIVKLHEMVETDKMIGIILEYASGGELFDYILHHRYLRDHAARRLFAQLVSGVGYLHKRGIIHRDLKLENLLLDRNKNIIITDFGFANTFDPNDELGDEVESKLQDRHFVKKMNLEAVQKNGFRRGDLMATSCGSPCYAAPELVVSDGIYTGRKVDVWSCGVILYAMLAGYLPFDDDPANPEGDNINLLYKYIVTTPLVFPEYVTPHARDLLRRILVPDPRKRADLFEVARHSWLNDFAEVVEFITSGITSPDEVNNIPINIEGQYGSPASLARSASVREPTRTNISGTPPGGVTHKPAVIDQIDETKDKTDRNAKRRTVQIEYMAPQSQNARNIEPTTRPAVNGAPVEPTYRSGASRDSPRTTQDRPQKDNQYTSHPPSSMQPLTRPARDAPRSASDSTPFTTGQVGSSGGRPSTGGTFSGSSRLPSRGSYGQPAVATVATTNAQGHFSQPKATAARQYVIGPTMSSQQASRDGVDGTAGYDDYSRNPSSYQQQPQSTGPPPAARGHKRSTTLGGFSEKLFRSSSISRKSMDRRPKPDRTHPPSSMRPVTVEKTDSPARESVDSKRSFGFKRSSRRFSLLSKNRKFADAYEQQGDSGSSGAAKKVMDFFRRRGRDREDEYPN